jgi:RND family efflux transporter MFP subunit
MPKKYRIVAAVAAIILIVAAVMLGPKLMEGTPPGVGTDSAGSTESDATAAMTVTVATPQVAVWPVEIEVSGWLAAWQEAKISAEVGGQRIVALNADVGDKVKRGDVLLELSRDSIENDILQSEASLDSAKATLEQATADADRVRGLSNTESVSQQQASEYLSTERQALANVASIEAQLASHKLNLKHTRITAVSDGVVSSRSADLGDVASVGQELLRLIRDGRIEWQAEVPLTQLISITPDTTVRLPTPSGDIHGTIRQIAPSVSQTDGRVKVYVSLSADPNGPEPKTGIMVNGIFEVSKSEAVSLPTSAIVLQDGYSYVFMLDGADPVRVRRQRVETGRRQWSRVELLNDFPRDAQVVESGGALLSDGSVVRISTGAQQGSDGSEGEKQ